MTVCEILDEKKEKEEQQYKDVLEMARESLKGHKRKTVPVNEVYAAARERFPDTLNVIIQLAIDEALLELQD